MALALAVGLSTPAAAQTPAAPAPFTALAWPNEAQQKNDWAVQIPWVMGLIGTRSITKEIPGIREIKDKNRSRILRGFVAVNALEALRALKAEFIVPGRGEAMKGQVDVNKALDYTKRWVETLYKAGQEAVAAKMDLKAAMAHTRKSMDPVFGHVFIYEHCLPFDVTRAYDEASGIKNPRIWTAERDMEMWKALQD